jgi:hypothetical protein
LEAVAKAGSVALAAAASASLTCEWLSPGDPLLNGALGLLNTDYKAIFLREDLSGETQSVLIAHEAGHFYLHGGESGGVTGEELDLTGSEGRLVGYGPRQRRETEANVFARELLLPLPLVRQLFYEEHKTAAEIASELQLPVSLVIGQLTDALTGDTSGTEDEADTDVEPPSALTLDESQEAAARADGGPILLGAGPGTGKTRTLTARLLFLVEEQGVSPDSILALTFSRKAAEEMRTRVAQHGPETAARAHISTFHAYGFDLLRRYWQEAGLSPHPILLDEADAAALLERHIADFHLDALRYLHDPAYPLRDMLKAISRAKEDGVSPEALAEKVKDTPGDDGQKWQETARVYAATKNCFGKKMRWTTPI